jgi:hypothetical protein
MAAYSCADRITASGSLHLVTTNLLVRATVFIRPRQPSRLTSVAGAHQGVDRVQFQGQDHTHMVI